MPAEPQMPRVSDALPPRQAVQSCTRVIATSPWDVGSERVERGDGPVGSDLLEARVPTLSPHAEERGKRSLGNY